MYLNMHPWRILDIEYKIYNIMKKERSSGEIQVKFLILKCYTYLPIFCVNNIHYNLGHFGLSFKHTSYLLMRV